MGALIEATAAQGIPHVADINGAAMEGDGGCGLANMLVRDGNERVSMAATYLRPVLDRPNLHVLLCAEVTRLRFDGTARQRRGVRAPRAAAPGRLPGARWSSRWGRSTRRSC